MVCSRLGGIARCERLPIAPLQVRRGVLDPHHPLVCALALGNPAGALDQRHGQVEGAKRRVRVRHAVEREDEVDRVGLDAPHGDRRADQRLGTFVERARSGQAQRDHRERGGLSELVADLVKARQRRPGRFDRLLLEAQVEIREGLAQACLANEIDTVQLERVLLGSAPDLERRSALVAALENARLRDRSKDASDLGHAMPIGI